MRLGQELAVVIDVDLLLPNLALRLALELFGLALELLARVARDAANRIAYATLDLVGHAFALVLQSIPRKIVRHGDPPGSSRWRLTRGDLSPLTGESTARHVPSINMCLSCRVPRACADISRDISYVPFPRYITGISGGENQN